jgi:hypothetical protein
VIKDLPQGPYTRSHDVIRRSLQAGVALRGARRAIGRGVREWADERSPWEETSATPSCVAHRPVTCLPSPFGQAARRYVRWQREEPGQQDVRGDACGDAEERNPEACEVGKRKFASSNAWSVCRIHGLASTQQNQVNQETLWVYDTPVQL